jgi:hypothetical protein
VDGAGLLGPRVFVDSGPLSSLFLGDNLADGIVVAPAVAAQVSEAELLRALRPKGTAFVGGRELVKPVPAGIDE